MPLTPAQTTQIMDVVEHMFDRLWRVESAAQKMRGAVEALEMWVIESADEETLHGRPTRASAEAEADLG